MARLRLNLTLALEEAEQQGKKICRHRDNLPWQEHRTPDFHRMSPHHNTNACLWTTVLLYVVVQMTSPTHMRLFDNAMLCAMSAIGK